MVIIWWWLSLIKLVNKIYQQKVCMYINHRYTIPFKRCLTWDNMITMFCFKIVWKTWPQRWFWLSRYGQRIRFVMKIFTELRYLIGIMNDTCACTVVHLERNELCMCIYQDKRSFNYTVSQIRDIIYNKLINHFLSVYHDKLFDTSWFISEFRCKCSKSYL